MEIKLRKKCCVVFLFCWEDWFGFYESIIVDKGMRIKLQCKAIDTILEKQYSDVI